MEAYSPRICGSTIFLVKMHISELVEAWLLLVNPHFRWSNTNFCWFEGYSKPIVFLLESPTFVVEIQFNPDLCRFNPNITYHNVCWFNIGYGLGEKLQENPILNGKPHIERKKKHGFCFRYSLQPTQ
jgi:hypothetical protein